MSTADANPWEQRLANQDPELRALSEGPPPADDMPVGDRTIPRAEFLSVLADQVSNAPDDGRRPIRPDRIGAGMLAAARRLIVFGQAQAVVKLLDAGFEVEAQANARVCFEHAVALQELALAADADKLDAAMGQLAGDAGRHQKRQLDHLDQVDSATGHTYRSLLDAARAEHELWLRPADYSGRQIKDMFENVSPGGALYSAYSRMSEASHAGLGSAVPYLQTELRAGSDTPAPPDEVPWAETAALLCWSCCAAEVAMLSFLTDGADRATQQVELLARVGLAPG